jgi:MFS family permease
MKVTREIMRPKNMSFLLLLFFFVNFALSLIIGVFPLYSENKFGWNEEQNGYYFGLIGIGSFVTQAFLIRLLLKKFDETQMIRMALLIFGVTVMAIGAAPLGFILLLLSPFTSFSFSLMNINVQSLISLESKQDEQGIVMGVAQSFGAIARVFGPLIGGAIATFNLSLPYIVSGIVAIMILVWGQGYLRFMRASKMKS